MSAVRVEPSKGFLLKKGSNIQYYNTNLGENISVKIIGHDKEGNNLGFLAVSPSTTLLTKALESFEQLGLTIELTGGDTTIKSTNLGVELTKFFHDHNLTTASSINFTPHYDEVILMGEDFSS
jgi:hypothetical protein